MPETLVPSAVFGPPNGGSSSGNQDKTVIEVSSPQAGMVLGVVLGSLVVLGLAVGVSQPLWDLFTYVILPLKACMHYYQQLSLTHLPYIYILIMVVGLPIFVLPLAF